MMVGDRDQWRAGKAPDDRRQIWGVQPIVDGREVGNPQTIEQRQVDPVRVAMQDVELLGSLGNSVQLRRIRRKRFRARAAQANGPRDNRDEPAVRSGVTTGKQRHLVTERNQLLGKP